jgi:hypothetical protein
MATRPRNLYLYLTLACFLGLIAIFIFDGYVGVYDTVRVTAGEREQRIEPDFWRNQDSYWSVGVNRGENAAFRYKVDNRRFSRYSAVIEASVWRGGEKVSELVSQPVQIGAFDEAEIEWVVNPDEFVPADVPTERGYEFSVVIERGDRERQIIMFVNPAPLPAAPPPVRSVD